MILFGLIAQYSVFSVVALLEMICLFCSGFEQQMVTEENKETMMEKM